MNKIPLVLSSRSEIPEYKTKHAAGADLYSSESVVIYPGEVCAVSTGLKMAIPIGYEGQIRPRSGLALDYKIFVANSPGTIDADYRGEIKVLLYNASEDSFEIKKGERIGQIIFNKVEQVEFKIVNELPSTDRGEGGFGHTGRN